MQKLKLLISILIVSIIIFSFSLPCFGNETTYVWSNDSKPLNQTSSNNTTNNTNENKTNSNNTTNNTNQNKTTTNNTANNTNENKETTNNTANNNKESITTNSSVDTSNSLNLESPSAILIEQTTGQVLYDHNSHEKLRPASVTKVMSILLIMEAIKDRSNLYD